MLTSPGFFFKEINLSLFSSYAHFYAHNLTWSHHTEIFYLWNTFKWIFFTFQSELQLLIQIIPEKFQRSVYDNVVQQGLESVVNEGEVSEVMDLDFLSLYQITRF